MPYQALYRQWRPKDFSHMVGQEAIVETLRHQVETGRIPHAYLFCGSRGTGKTSTAKILARAINCEHPVHGDPCGECETCRRMNSEESLDIIEMDAASNNGVEDARTLREAIKYPPQFGKYKVYILDEVHMLSKSAFNALLKTLEEPPAHIVFIMATTEPQSLPATILSRCQRFDFGRIPARQIMGRLREAADGAGADATDGALMAIAKAAEGGMRDALSILDMCIGYGQKVDEKLVQNVLGTSDRAFLFRFSDALKEENAGNVIRLIDELMRSGKEPIAFTRSVSDHLRTLLMAKCCGGEIAEVLDLSDQTADTYLRAAENISASRVMEMLDHFMTLETDIKYMSSPRIALENVSLKCCLRTKEVDTLALTDRIAELENQISALQDQIAKGIPAQTAETLPPDEKKTATSRKPAAEKQAPPAQKTLTPTGRSADETWKEALRQLQKNETMIYSFLACGQYAGSDGTEYRWRANPSYEIMVRQLNDPAKRMKIEEALTNASGVPSTFLAMDMANEIRKQEEKSDEEYVKELVDTFGSEPVDVVEELPKEI